MMFEYMTTRTRNNLQGKPAGDVDMTNRKPKAMGTNTAKPPRTREGQNFPGGRALRRALKNLSALQNGFAPDIKGTTQQTKAGSMTR